MSASATSPRISSLHTICAAAGGVLLAYAAAAAAYAAEEAADVVATGAAAVRVAGVEPQPASTASNATVTATRAVVLRRCGSSHTMRPGFTGPRPGDMRVMRIITEVISRDELAEHMRVAPGCTTEAGHRAGAAAIEPIAARSL